MANEQDSGKKKAISLEDLKDGMTAEELNNGPLEETQEQETGSAAEKEVKTETKQEPEGQKTEQASTESKENSQEQKTEEKSETEKSTSQQFDFSVLNKQLSKSYESFDQIKADIEKPTMESEYEDVKKQLEEWQGKYNDLNKDYDLLTEQLDPAAYFSSDEAMRLEAFKKANPDKDASIAQKIFATEDLSSIEDLDMVKMGWRFSTPNLKGTDKDLEISIAEELGQDPETPIKEWSVSAQNRLARMAAEYANQFKQIKSSVTLPEKLNIEQLKAQRKQADDERLTQLSEGWTKIADESLKGTLSVKLPVGKPEEGEEQSVFVWELKEPPKAEVDTLKERYISMGMDPEENKEAFQETLNLALIQQNLPQIMLKYGEDLLAHQQERHLEETNNTNALKDTERTEQTSADKEKQEQTAFATAGLYPRFRNNPLFKTSK